MTKIHKNKRFSQNKSKKFWAKSKYCSQPCSIKNTQVQKQNFDRSAYSHDAWNKGIKGLHFSPKTQFKKGNSINVGRVRLDMQGKNNPKWTESVIRNCTHCLIEMSLKPWQLKNRKRFFCNRICWAFGTRGNGSPVYKGEKAVSRLRNRVAYLPEYRQWHAHVLKRDGYQCVLCGSKKNLEVDHIKRFLYIANEYELRTPEDARACKELWDTNNGRTLCNPCHRASDTYGTKGTKKLINQKTKI